jgi:signal transduction histidine kinase
MLNIGCQNDSATGSNSLSGGRLLLLAGVSANYGETRVWSRGNIVTSLIFAFPRTSIVKRSNPILQRAERFAAVDGQAPVLAHDFPNPLQAITWATCLLKSESMLAERKNELLQMFALQIVERSVENAAATLRDLLVEGKTTRKVQS